MAARKADYMRVIGITGGVGCGKSTVLKLIKDNYNACIIMADEVGRMLMETGGAAYVKIVDIFGEDILCEDKTIDRARLANIVFNNKNKLVVLNSIVHPLVKKHIMEDIADKRCRGVYDYYFVEAALLIEDHYDVICDELWYIYAEDEVRIKRLMDSRGYDLAKCESLFKNQLSKNEFEKHCAVVIDNSRDLEYTLSQIKAVLPGKE
ncbi:MAG: dephospho-CoA kinase [Lachnospiraceae bacterium]